MSKMYPVTATSTIALKEVCSVAQGRRREVTPPDTWAYIQNKAWMTKNVWGNLTQVTFLSTKRHLLLLPKKSSLTASIVQYLDLSNAV